MDRNDRGLLIRDTREKVGHGYDWGEDDIFRGTTIEGLSVGDYSIKSLEHKIFIDRKASVMEIVQNFSEKRFHDLIKKAKNYKYKYIICEFTMEELENFPFNTDKAYAKDKNGVPLWKKIRARGSTLKKTVNTIQTKYGIQFIFCDGRRDAQQECYDILRKIYIDECSNKEKS